MELAVSTEGKHQAHCQCGDCDSNSLLFALTNSYVTHRIHT